MDIDITVPARLDLFRGHKKFLVKLLIKLIKNQAALRGDKGAVRISVLLVADVHDRLALLVDVVHHAHKILLVIAVIAVALRHNRLHVLQRTLHNIVHDLDRYLLLVQLVHLVNYRLADMTLLLLRKLREGTVCALPHCIDDLLDIKCLQTAILLDHFHTLIRLVLKTVILPIRTIRFKFTAHTPLRNFIHLQSCSVFHKI